MRVLPGRRNVGEVCQGRKSRGGMRAGSGPRRADRGPFRGFERARADHAEPIRHRASRRREIVERTRVPHVRTFEGPSAFRFAAHFLVAEPSVGKNRATRGEKVGQTSGRATEPTVCEPPRRAPREYLAESRRAGTHRGRAAGVSATTSPNPSRAPPRTTRGDAFRGKPARASVKNSPSRPVSGKAGTRASGDYRAGKTPRSASEACSRA